MFVTIRNFPPSATLRILQRFMCRKTIQRAGETAVPRQDDQDRWERGKEERGGRRDDSAQGQRGGGQGEFGVLIETRTKASGGRAGDSGGDAELRCPFASCYIRSRLAAAVRNVCDDESGSVSGGGGTTPRDGRSAGTGQRVVALIFTETPTAAFFPPASGEKKVLAEGEGGIVPAVGGAIGRVGGIIATR